MLKKVVGKIILVDDMKYEKDLLEDALHSRNWEIKVEYFSNAQRALEHLEKNADEIFLIISDMHMPGMNGMDFKKAIDASGHLRQKSIPFIFASSKVSRQEVVEAYQYRVQGFFEKPDTIDEQAIMLEKIIQYWIACHHPNKADMEDEL